jgi:predicted LPLAT superfamily acyltransferase
MRFTFWVHRRLGRLPFRAVLLFVVGYFYLAQPQRRQASREYLGRLKQALNAGPGPSAWAVWRHFWAFAETAVDKLLAWDPAWDGGDVTFHGHQPLLDRLAAGKGFLLVGSHLGNLEVGRALGRLHKGRPITVLVHTLHAQKFNDLMRSINPRSQVDLIQVTQMGPATAALLRERIDAGGVVLIAGDRVPVGGGARGVVRAPLLGAEAAFPLGPWVLASVLECPVHLYFCLGGAGRWDMHFEPFADKVLLPRGGREQAAQALAARYAERLGYYCSLAPLEWGNFHSPWSEG